MSKSCSGLTEKEKAVCPQWGRPFFVLEQGEEGEKGRSAPDVSDGPFSAARKRGKERQREGCRSPSLWNLSQCATQRPAGKPSARKVVIDTSINHHRCRWAAVNFGFAPLPCCRPHPPRRRGIQRRNESPLGSAVAITAQNVSKNRKAPSRRRGSSQTSTSGIHKGATLMRPFRTFPGEGKGTRRRLSSFFPISNHSHSNNKKPPQGQCPWGGFIAFYCCLLRS